MTDNIKTSSISRGDSVRVKKPGYVSDRNYPATFLQWHGVDDTVCWVKTFFGTKEKVKASNVYMDGESIVRGGT